MFFLNNIQKRTTFIMLGIFVLALVNSCGIYKPVDARKVSPNADERVRKNLEEGRGFSLMGGKDKNTNYQFASSNPMWRATLEILDFLPLANVDYSGGIIITEWITEGISDDEAIKITVRFLSNEIRADGLKVIIYKKICKKNEKDNCKVIKDNSTLGQEIKLAILQKAATIKNSEVTKDQKEYTTTGSGIDLSLIHI